jgi:hypothetical protein
MQGGLQVKKIFIVLFCVVVPAMAQTVTPPKVTMQFSSDRILLGEPVWVLVTARNDAGTAIKWNPGDYCFMDSEQPVTAVVSGAAPGDGKPKGCTYGAMGGDCFVGGYTTEIAPGESATWRYLLEGDFHFTHAGTYRVELTSHPGKVPVEPDENAMAPLLLTPVTQTLTLVVLSRDDAALLAREKQMATEMEEEILSQKHTPTTKAEREASWREMQNVRQVRRGLAVQPTTGMEPIFEHWLQLPNDFEGDAILGLQNLNTEESRAELADIAKTPNKPNSYAQEAATRALAEMGDRKYYPLMVQLLASPDQRVRRAAIVGVGNLGGEVGVAKLAEIAQTGGAMEQGDALTALGDTKSRAAVKVLIDLMTVKNLQHPLDAEWPLFVLTHHRLDRVTYLRTPEQAHEAWQQWWNAGGKNSPVYSPTECAPKGAF